MNKDFGQKGMLLKHFSSQGWLAQPEVVVYHRGGVFEQKKVITDIDVLALRPGINLTWEIILGDCKTLKGQSPANRALWLKGLMGYFNASKGMLVLKKDQPIEIDHKLFASELGVTLLNEDEFSDYDKTIVYPDGSSGYSMDITQVTALKNVTDRYPNLKPLTEYLYTLSWNENSFIDLVRKLLGEAQQVSHEIDPSKKEHLAVILDSCAIFSIGLAQCVGIIFKQYLKPETQNQLDESLKFLIWGGRSQYDFVSKLRNELISARKGVPSPLALPEWDKFLQVTRTLLENPTLVFSLPLLFRRAAVDVLFNKPFLESYNSENDLLLLKFGMLVSSYFCRATKMPPQMRETLEQEFVKLQSKIVQTTREKVEVSKGLSQKPDSIDDKPEISVDNSKSAQPELPLKDDQDNQTQ